MMKQAKLWTNKYFVALSATIACVLWGSAFPVLKITYAELGLTGDDTASRVVLAGGRFLLAALLLFALLKIVFRQSIRLEKEYILPVLSLGIFQTGLQYFFFYNGLAFTGGIKGAVLNALGNFLVVIFAHFIYKDDRLNPGKIIGIITGFAGIVLINWHGAAGFSWSMSFRGEGFLVLSGLAGVVGTFQAKKLGRSLNPVLINAYQLLFGSLVLLFVGLPGVVGREVELTGLFWGLFLYSAFLSAAAFSIWYYLLKYNRAGEVTVYRFMIPVSGTLLSALLLPDERLTPAALLSLALVAFGIRAVNYWKTRQTPLDRDKLRG
mgnify:CR=1 FL=1